MCLLPELELLYELLTSGDDVSDRGGRGGRGDHGDGHGGDDLNDDGGGRDAGDAGRDDDGGGAHGGAHGGAGSHGRLTRRRSESLLPQSGTERQLWESIAD